ncbi:MAG: methyl-accepting chemotaxis protein [bacterium]|nr:methyl-accepting chemotaxis protein [bacterium]
MQKKTSTKEHGMKIFYKLLLSFAVPIVLMIILGVMSYRTAANSAMKKYEESAGSTMASMAQYCSLLCNTAETKCAELLINSEITDYYGLYATSTDKTAENKAYETARTATLNLATITKYFSDVHMFAKNGRPTSSATVNSSKRIAFEDTAYDNFQLEEGAPFAADTTVKGFWVGHHPYIDAQTDTTEDKYAISFMKKFTTGKGFVAADISVGAIKDILMQAEAGNGSLVGIVTPDGREIILQGEEIVSDPIFESQSFYIDSASAGESFGDYVKYDGKNYLYLYEPIGTTGISLCSLIPQENIVGEVSSLRNTTIIFVLIASIIAIGIGFVLSRSISTVLNHVSKSMKSAADGNLTVDVATTRKDEFGQLTGSIEAMLVSMRSTLEEVQQFGGSVGMSAEEVANTSGRISLAMKEVNQAISDMEHNVISQASDAESGYNKMVAFSDKINHIYGITGAMQTMAGETINSISKGTGRVTELDRTATTTAAITRELLDNIADVNSQSENIGGFINTINDIAEETNLLSLNASIEAARAGESGRGFAVVAEAIGKLAEQSMTSSNQIGKIIEDIQNTNARTSASASQAEENIRQQTAAIAETVEVFAEINRDVQELVEKLETIITDMGMLASDKDDVLNSIQAVMNISENSVASTEEVTATINEQVDFITRLAEDATRLKNEADQLESKIQHFNI